MKTLTAKDLEVIRSLVDEARLVTGRRLGFARGVAEQQFYSATMKHLTELSDRLRARNADKLLERALAAEAAADETGEQEEQEDEE